MEIKKLTDDEMVIAREMIDIIRYQLEDFEETGDILTLNRIRDNVQFFYDLYEEE